MKRLKAVLTNDCLTRGILKKRLGEEIYFLLVVRGSKDTDIGHEEVKKMVPSSLDASSAISLAMSRLDYISRSKFAASPAKVRAAEVRGGPQ